MPQTLRGSFEQALRPLPSVVKGVSSLPFARPQMPQTLHGSFEQALRPLPYVVKGVLSLPFARPQMPQTLRGSFEQALRPLPSVVKGVQACRLPDLKCLKGCAAASSRHSGHCPLLRAFKRAVCRPQMPKTLRGSFEQALRPLPSVVKGVQGLPFARPQCLKRCAAASSRHSGHCVVKDIQACRLPASNASNAARQLRAGTQATALCC